MLSNSGENAGFDISLGEGGVGVLLIGLRGA